MNDSTLTTSTAGLFIEESDDENQDDDLHHNNNNNNNNNNINNQNRARMSQSNVPSAMSISEASNTQQLINNEMDSQFDDIKQDSKEQEQDDIDDDEEFPISDVIELLTIAWRNEKLAPEILEYEQEYVERVKQAIDEKEEEIEDLDEELRTNENAMDNKIQSASIYWFKKEIERIKYILHSYLRIRIWKIQKYILYILSDDESYNKLSQQEQKFAAAYSDINERHFKNTFVRDLPDKYQQLTDQEMIIKPDLNRFVVIKANENDDNLMLDGGKHVINLQKNNIFVAKYKSFKHLIAQGTVDLI